LRSYAAAQGKPATDLDTQLGFLWSELQGPEHGAFAALIAATTPAQAATVFDRQYERSSASSLPARIAAAEAIAAGGVSGGSGLSNGGGVANAWNPIGGMWDGLLSALAPLGRLAVDAFLVITGVVLIIVGVVVIAKASTDSERAGATPPPAADVDAPQRAPEESGRTGRRAGAESDAADAAVLA
jgi:predicted lipid-binding transport protein (Tim44 family)